MTAVSIEWALALALAAPHALYAFIWFFPETWQGRFGKRSVLVFDSCAWVLKGTGSVPQLAIWLVCHLNAAIHSAAARNLHRRSVHHSD